MNLLIGLCVMNCVAQSPAVIMPFWVEGLTASGVLSPTTAALMTGWERVAGALANLVMLRFVFSFSIRSLALVSIGSIVIGNLACLLMVEPTVWFGRTAVGIGSGILLALAQALAAQSSIPGRTYSLMFAALLIFSLALFNMTPVAMRYGGPSALFILFAVLYLACVLALGRLGGTLRTYASPTAQRPQRRYSWAVWLAVAGASFNVQGLWVYAFAGGVRVNLATETITAAMSVSLACGFIGGLLAAYLTGRVHRLAILCSGLGLLAAATYLFGYAPSGFLYLTALCFIPLGTCLLLPVLSEILAGIDPQGRDAAAAPIAILAGSALGSPAVGIAIAHGRYDLFAVTSIAALLIALALSVVAARSTRSVSI